MWKSLSLTQKVYQGDTIRFNNASREGINVDTLFQVVRTDQHYFEVQPVNQNLEALQDLTKKIVRYFDIGYYIQIEIWDGNNGLEAAAGF